MIVAVLDACVLYPPSLRDLLMWLATVGAYSPRWTEHIHDEWMRNILKDNPEVPRHHLERTRRLMNAVKPGSLVVEYEQHIPKLRLPDPDDRHVLAAAIQARALHIVTFNISDFPSSTLTSYGVRAVHPDYFLSALLEDNPQLFLQGVREHRASLKNPPKSPKDYIDTLTANRLYDLVSRMEAYTDFI